MRSVPFLLTLGILGACGGKILDKNDAEPPPTTTTTQTVPTTPPPPPPTKPPPPPPPTGCSAEDVTGFVPPALHPPRAKQTSCTQTQIDAYWSSCLDKATASSSKCSAFVGNSANKACASCMVSNHTDATWGPLVQGKGIIDPNISGCVAMVTGDTSSSSCTHHVQASLECQRAACSSNCPVVDDASYADYLACMETAKAGGCASFEKAAQCIQSPPQSKCAVMLTGFKTAYDLVVPMFCL